MQTKPMLTLEDVKKIAAGAEAEALPEWLEGRDRDRRRRRPPAVAAAPGRRRADLGPHRAGQGQDRRARPRESKVYEDMINNGRISFLSRAATGRDAGRRRAHRRRGPCVGAVGVSGVKSAEDAQIAKAGIARSPVSPVSRLAGGRENPFSDGMGGN
jgi:glc operon protein GlcG